MCAGVHGCARVLAVVGGSAWVCGGVHGCSRCAWVCRDVREYAWVCVDMHGYAHVCGMNFQNFFWRIEYLHQRTLIRFLYEFFFSYSRKDPKVKHSSNQLP